MAARLAHQPNPTICRPRWRRPGDGKDSRKDHSGPCFSISYFAEKEAKKLPKRIGCLKCRLIEPTPGEWAAGVCARRNRPATDSVAHPQAGGRGDGQRAAGAGTGRRHRPREECGVYRRRSGAPERAGTARPRHHRRAARPRATPVRDEENSTAEI